MPKFRRSPAALAAAGAALFLSAGAAAWASTDGPGHDQTASVKKAKPHTNRGPRGRRGPQGPRGLRAFRGRGRARGSGRRRTIRRLHRAGGGGHFAPCGHRHGRCAAHAPGGRRIHRHGSDRTRGHEHCRGFRDCTLLEGASAIGGGSTELPTQAAFAATITLTGATSGGTISLSCNSDNAAQARNNVITAIKVGTLHTS